MTGAPSAPGIDLPLMLAPLADFTDAAFRLVCRQSGADRAYTEMVSAAALAHGHAATRFLLETLPGEGPVGCQIFGADVREIAHAAPAPAAAADAGSPMPAGGGLFV